MEKYNNKIKVLKVIIIILVIFVTFWALYLKFGYANLIYKSSYKPMIKWSVSKRFFWTLSPFHKVNPYDYKLRDFILNIISFIPFGFSISMLINKKKFLKVLFYGLIFTCFIELSQFITIFGGIAINDVVSNAIGAICGLGCFVAFDKIIKNNNIKNIIYFILFICLFFISIYAIYTIINSFELFFKMFLRKA